MLCRGETEICGTVSNIGLRPHPSSTLGPTCQTHSSILYIRRRYHVLLSLPRISISRIPSLLSLPLALLYPRPLPDLARLRENLCRISITTSLNRSFPPPPQTLSSTKLMYRRVPAYTTFTFTPGLVNSASFVWTLLPNLFLATSCLLFFLQG